MEDRREQRRQQRQAQIRKKQQQAAGCFTFLTILLLLLGGFVIFRALDSAGQSAARPEPNPYDPSDFATRSGYVTCTAGPVLRGIDVSEHQGKIDWEAVKDGGFDFAFVRIGYRGYTVGSIKTDDRALENLAGARAAGLDVGVYFYAQAVSPAEAAEEAAWCLDFLAGQDLDLPLVYDWEWVGPSARTGGMDKATLTECVTTFCNAIRDGGYDPMVYFNAHLSRDLLDLEALTAYPWWFAQYKDQLDFPYRVDVWQYTEKGTVPGIEGDVDIDLMFLY